MNVGFRFAKSSSCAHPVHQNSNSLSCVKMITASNSKGFYHLNLSGSQWANLTIHFWHFCGCIPRRNRLNLPVAEPCITFRVRYSITKTKNPAFQAGFGFCKWRITESNPETAPGRALLFRGPSKNQSSPCDAGFSGPMTSCMIKPCNRKKLSCRLCDFRFFSFFSMIIAADLLSHASHASNTQGRADLVDGFSPLLCFSRRLTISSVWPM